MRRFLAVTRRRPSLFAGALAVSLFVANVAVIPEFVGSGQIAPTLGTLAPFAVAGMASTPAFLSGGGGIDLSIAPLMGLVNIVLVTRLLGTSFGSIEVAVPILLALGAAIGAINGVLVARLRFPPVIATLGMFFLLSGLDLRLVPTPVNTSSRWLHDLGGSIGSVPGATVTVGVPLLLWFLLRRTAYVETLQSVGDHDATAFSSGVRVDAVRVSAYALGGLIAADGGIALSGLIQSADSNTFNNYILVALAAVALGGTNLAGGRGGLLASALGATYIQVAYGGALLTAVVFGSLAFSRPAEAI